MKNAEGEKRNTMFHDFTEVQLNDVQSVYSGKDGKCCCGCSGNRWYAFEHREAASASHGYDISDRINNAQVARVFNLLKRNVGDVEKVCGTCFCLTQGDRLYIVYTGA